MNQYARLQRYFEGPSEALTKEVEFATGKKSNEVKQEDVRPKFEGQNDIMLFVTLVQKNKQV